MASAAYKGSDYATAADAYQKSLKTERIPLQEDAYYGLGNTQYRQGQKAEQLNPSQTIQLWQQAVRSYYTALQLNPKDADAKFNRDFVTKKLEQLQKQQQQQQQQQSSQAQQNQQQNQSQYQQKQSQQQQNQKPQQQNQSGQSQQPKPNPQSLFQNRACGRARLRPSRCWPRNFEAPQKRRPTLSEVLKETPQSQDQAKAGQQQQSQPKPQSGKPNENQANAQPKQAGQKTPPQQPAPQPQAAQPPPEQNQNAEANRVPGQMTKEEAKNLLDSLRSNERRMPLTPYARAGGRPRTTNLQRIGNMKSTLPFFRIWTATLGLVGAMALSASARDLTVTARLDPAEIALVDAGQLSVTVTGAEHPAVDIPPVAGMSFANIGQSSQYQLVNGTGSSSVTYLYNVLPTRAGTFHIPRITVRDGSDVANSNPLILRVLKKSSGSATPSQGGLGNFGNAFPPGFNAAPSDDEAPAQGEVGFLRLRLPKREFYVGEMVLVDIAAYVRAGAEVSLDGLPTLSSDAFTLNNVSDKPERSMVNVSGEPYTVLRWHTAIAAVTGDAFDQANREFAQQHFAKAVQGYKTVIVQNGYSAPVLFDLANAYAREGKWGPAILNYQRARLLAPRDADIAANLKFAREKAGLSASPSPWYAEGAQFLSPNGWAWIGILNLLAACTSVLAVRFYPPRRLALRWITALGAITWLAAIGAGVFWWQQGRRAVVVEMNAPLRVAPALTADAAGFVPQGDSVKMQETHGAFALIEDTSGHRGWINRAQIARVATADRRPAG